MLLSFIVATAVALAAVLAPSTPGSAGTPPIPAQAAITWPAPSAYVAPSLQAAAVRAPAREVEVIVQALPQSAVSVQDAMAAAGATGLRALPIINGIYARMGAARAAALAGTPGVRAVSLNHRVAGQALAPDGSRLATAFNQSIRANKAWDQGVTGSGVGVAVIDTGIAGDLADFRGADGKSRVTAVATVNPTAPNANDSFGHGTHIAGLIAGNAPRYAGVAPDANLISVKADDGHGRASELDLIDALQFVVTHKDQLNIRVVNLSVRSTVAESYKTSPLDAAVEAVWNRGIVVVTAAGNLSTASDAVSYPPGNDPYVITVGGVDDMGTKSVDDDQIATWSSRGTTQDGVAKPDVYAPGAHMIAPLAPGAEYATMCPTCVVDGSYLKIGGTSMAAGVASGAVADIISAHPDWSPDQVKGSLVKRTRTLLGPGGVGTTDGEIAVDKVINSDPRVANRGLTPSQWINPSTGDINLQAGSWSAGSWSAGSWSAGSWSAGSWSAATGDFAPAWAAAAYTGAPLSPDGFTATPVTCSELSRAGWSAGSWSAGSWSSADLSSARQACDDAAAQAATQAGSWSAGSWSAGSWSAGSWSAGSWSAGSWSAGSWSTAFDK